MISRRSFLVLGGGALVPLRSVHGKEEVPPMLDHVLLGCNDLERGITFVERHVGVRAVFGGVHPGRGTQNALLSLGERRYLEVIAPDPKQTGSGYLHDRILKLAEPRIAGWAAHVSDMDRLAAQLRNAGIAFQGPQPGSRTRPDGRVLNWKSLVLDDDDVGLLPFFIEWGADSLHPSMDAPKGCSIERFEAVTPNPGGLTRRSASLGLDLPIAKGEPPQLRVVLAGPKGKLSVTS
ncbi:MAG TPA: VOC family protein [Acidobacteriota bacterium]|nr:VOC family protein [Acidobacteriota bacterium]